MALTARCCPTVVKLALGIAGSLLGSPLTPARVETIRGARRSTAHHLVPSRFVRDLVLWF